MASHLWSRRYIFLYDNKPCGKWRFCFDPYLSYFRILLQQAECRHFWFAFTNQISYSYVTGCNMRASRLSPPSRSSCSSSERGESKQLNGMGSVLVHEYTCRYSIRVDKGLRMFKGFTVSLPDDFRGYPQNLHGLEPPYSPAIYSSMCFLSECQALVLPHSLT